MPDAHREQWLAILESAATNPGDVQNEEWTWLMRELGQPLAHFPAVLRVIREGGVAQRAESQSLS